MQFPPDELSHFAMLPLWNSPLPTPALSAGTDACSSSPQQHLITFVRHLFDSSAIRSPTTLSPPLPGIPHLLSTPPPPQLPSQDPSLSLPSFTPHNNQLHQSSPIQQSFATPPSPPSFTVTPTTTVVGPTQAYHTMTFSAKPLKQLQKNSRGKGNMSKKRKRWSPEDMEQAISLVEKNKMSARAAALVSNVPRSTLWDRLCQRSSYQGRSQKVKRRRQSLS